MSEFNYKSVCILGRLPAIGIAELERLYGNNLKRLEKAALLEVPAEDINFKRLGGTVKVARILTVLPTTDWGQVLDYLIKNVPDHLQYAEPGKFTLGISLYGIKAHIKALNAGVLRLKKVIKESGRSVRIVPNKELELNSAQVLHNKLTHRGAWELLLIKDAEQTVIAQTLFVQDIDAYAARDQARPKRDARVGMLPPKLAQTLINLASGGKDNLTVLDPFCGTGVVLQEALLMGYDVYGSDIEPRMVEFTNHNLEWLKQQYPNVADTSVKTEVADATSANWNDGIDAVASETFLGRPLSSLPPPDKLREIIQDANTINRKFLKNIYSQLNSDACMCVAVPAWRRPNGEVIHLPLIDQLTDMGYNRLDLKNVDKADLIYSREDQTVARELLILSKR